MQILVPLIARIGILWHICVFPILVLDLATLDELE